MGTVAGRLSPITLTQESAVALPVHSIEELRAAFASLGMRVVLAEGEDLDEAFDNAVTAAYNDSAVGSVFTGIDPEVVKATGSPAPLDVAVSAAVSWACNLVEGSDAEDSAERADQMVAAFPLLARTAHVRTTRRARVEGVEFEVAGGPAAAWMGLPDDLAAAVADAGAGPEAGETLERVAVVRRARYKPVASANKGPSGAQFVVMDAERIVSTGHPTATAAKKAAVEHIKTLGHEMHERVSLRVFKLVGRAEGVPLVDVERSRIKQTLNVKLVYCSPKPAAKPAKIVGWLFVAPDAAS